jgi:hypothetical protein
MVSFGGVIEGEADGRSVSELGSWAVQPQSSMPPSPQTTSGVGSGSPPQIDFCAAGLRFEKFKVLLLSPTNR